MALAPCSCARLTRRARMLNPAMTRLRLTAPRTPSLPLFAVPVVHAVGGLRDTVKPFNPFENAGTGGRAAPCWGAQRLPRLLHLPRLLRLGWL